MNYTEEQYSELYNNLPKGLRDLVLTGNLTTAVGAIAMKYGLTPEETSELEPAVEDVALGLVTPEELAENIFIQVGVDDERAQAIAGEAMRSIYGEYLEELRLTRKYKIELDTRIRKEEEAKNPPNEAEEVNVGGEKVKVAGNIINITRESNNAPLNVSENETDKKVADWFSGKKTSTRAELDALGEDFSSAPRAVPIQKTTTTIAPQIPTNTAPKNLVLDKPVTPTVSSPKSAWEEVTSLKSNNLKPTTQPTISPSKTVIPQAPGKDFEKSMVQVEQQILTLTQAVNKMIDQNSKTINPVVQSVFNSGQYEEVSRRMDAMNHRIDDLQAKLLMLIDEHRKDVSHISQSNKINVANYTENKKTDTDNLVEEYEVNESAIDRIIKIKKEEPGIPKPTTQPQTLTSTISKNVLDGIFQIKKESVGNPITITKTADIKNPETVTTMAQPAPDTAPNTRSTAREQLLKDLEILKKSVATAQPEAVQEKSVSLEVPAIDARSADNLKEEINPSDSLDKMKSLQDKIKSLNKGITQGGIVSAGNVATDPYRL